MGLLGRVVLGNSVGAWLIGLGVALALWAALVSVRRPILRRLQATAAGTASKLDDLLLALLQRTGRLAFGLLAVFVGSQFLAVPAGVRSLLRAGVVVGALVQAGVWGNAVIRHSSERYLATHEGDGAASTVAAMGTFLGHIVLWTLLALLVLDNLGVNISALLAGLGVGGVAVALATQNILGDLFASLSIMLDRPFVVGDQITVDTFSGTVERVGLKTTRVRSVSGELLVFSNTDLLKSRIVNHKRMTERRVVLSVGVVYETSQEKVAAIPTLLREAIEGREQVRFGRAHFKSFGDSALVFEAVYFVLKPDLELYLELQQSINLAVLKGFSEKGIDFAYPTRTLRLSA